MTSRPLRGARYAEKIDPDLVQFIQDELPYLDYVAAGEFYQEVLKSGKHPEVINEVCALIGCNDRYFLLTGLLNRKDAIHPWLYARCREVERDPDGYLDLWSRYHYKSSIITFAGAIQEIVCDPEIRIGIFSNTKHISSKFLQQIKSELESNANLIDTYKDVLWENPKRDAASWSVEKGLTVQRKSNPKEATLEAHGLIEGMPTGRHFPLHIYDDVITQANVTNPEQIAKARVAIEMADNLGELTRTRKWFIGTRYCSIGSMQILMGDWSHKPIEDVRIGDTVVGWELRDGKRYLCPAKVVDRGIHFRQPVKRFTLTTGRSVTCTDDHQWWRGAHGGGREYAPLGLPIGGRKDRPPKGKKAFGRLVALRQLLIPVEIEQSHDAGWLAGFFDGEGTMNLNTGENRASGSVCITQTLANPGLIKQTRKILKRLHFTFSESWVKAEGRTRMTSDRCIFTITGGWRERYRFLAQIAPAKRAKLAGSLFAKLQTERVKLVSVTDAGAANVHWLETETGNYVIEGFCSSNSFADTYGQMMADGIVKPRIYPATRTGTLDTYTKSKDGKQLSNLVLLSPERWDEVKKNQRSTIAAQMLQNPLAGEENLFKPEWLAPYWVRPPMMNVYIMADPSLGAHKTSDRTAIAVVGIDSLWNKYLLDGYCQRMALSEKWQRLRDLYKKWGEGRMPGVQSIKVGYERYGQQADAQYFEEKMKAEGIRFEILELNWTRNRGGESKAHRVGRLEPDFRNASFFLPAKVWHPGSPIRPEHMAAINAGKLPRPATSTATWRVNEKGEIVYAAYAAMDPQEIHCKRPEQPQPWRLIEPLRRTDEDGNIYDLTRVFFEEYLFFPFSPRDDLVDATSRIYDMDPMNAVVREVMETVSYPDD